MECMIKRRPTSHNSGYASRLAVPSSNSYSMNNFIAYRGAIIWNLLSPVANGRGIIEAFIKKAWQSKKLKQLNFSFESPTVMQQMDQGFVYF